MYKQILMEIKNSCTAAASLIPFCLLLPLNTLYGFVLRLRETQSGGLQKSCVVVGGTTAKGVGRQCVCGLADHVMLWVMSKHTFFMKHEIKNIIWYVLGLPV